MTESSGTTVKNWAIGVAVVLFLAAMIALGRTTDAPGEGPVPARSSPADEECAYRWELNRETVSGGAMTRERYIQNCKATMRDLEDGKLGN